MTNGRIVRGEGGELMMSDRLGPYLLGPNDENQGIYIGDAKEFLAALPPKSVSMFLFSPPYNLGVTTGGGFATGSHYNGNAPLGKRGGNDKWYNPSLAYGYGAHDDAMSPFEYREWQKEILRLCWSALSEDGAIYYQHKPRILAGKLQTPLDFNPDLPVRQIVIWARAGGINFSPTFYCPTHEWIVIFAKDGFSLRDRAASGIGDVWNISQEINTWHPAPFPERLALMAIETVMPKIIVDPFIGSGTTAVAAKILGIRFLGNDNNAEYVRKARQRVRQTQPPLFTLEAEQLRMEAI